MHGTILQRDFEFPHHVLTLKNFWKDRFIIFDSEEHRRKGHDILIPRTKGISSTKIRENINEDTDNL